MVIFDQWKKMVLKLSSFRADPMKTRKEVF